MFKRSFFLLFVFACFISPLVFAVETSLPCIGKACQKEADFYCQACNRNQEPRFFYCRDCFSAAHKRKNMIHHKPMSEQQYRKNEMRHAPFTKAQLRDNYYQNLFVGHDVKSNPDEDSQIELVFGAGFKALVESDTKKIVSFVSPTGSGKSFAIRSLLPEDSAKPYPSEPSSLASTTSDSAVYFSEEEGVAYIDVEGMQGTLHTVQGTAIQENKAPALEKELALRRRMMTKVFPPLLYSISDVMVYMRFGSVSTIKEYTDHLLNLGRTAASRMVNTQKPVLFICFNRMSLYEIEEQFRSEEDGIEKTTDAWKKNFPTETKQLEKYFSSIHVVFLPDDRYVNYDALEAFHRKLTNVLKETEEKKFERAIERQLMFAEFKQSAQTLVDDPFAYVNVANYFTEQFAKAWLRYFEQIAPEDFDSFKRHLEMALQLNLHRWLQGEYRPIEINLLANLAFDDVPDELPKRLANLFASRLSCQATKEFTCPSKSGPFTVKCDTWPWNHEDGHKSHQVFLTRAFTPEEIYWADQNQYNSQPCHWEGEYACWQGEGEVAQFDPSVLIASTLQKVKFYYVCSLCLSATKYPSGICEDHSLCSMCMVEFQVRGACVVCQKDGYLEKMKTSEQ